MSFDLLEPALQHHIVNSLGWSSLRPLQEATIEPILAGETVLAVAPTAGGKTEAAMFPLLSRMTTEQWTGLSVLYVCPLKALLNNLAPRLATLAGFLGRRVALWHGDVTGAARSRLLDDPPDILLTTPESIEAMLISRRTDHNTLFAGVRAVVVDEIHAFGGDDRGWHLLAVLARLSAVCGKPIQRIGLSATVGDPAALLSWLQAGDIGPARVVNPSAGLPVAPDLTVDYVHGLDNAALVTASLHHGEKRLVFADSRARVEELATGLRARDVTTFVSHSSLSLDQRRQAEQAFTEARDCVIVSTSTLELGIDVGDLDRVIQLGSPTTVASFLQRLGRTGRRPGTTRNMLFLGLRPELNLAVMLGVLLRWSEGFVEPITPPPEPLHLLVQQLLALVLQEGQVGRNLWQAQLARVPVLHGFIEDGRAAEIVDHMVEIDMLVEDHGMLSIGPEAEQSFGFRHFMDLTSLFTTNPMFLVRWGTKDLGQLDPIALIEQHKISTPILLGGRVWDITGIDWRGQTVTVVPSEHDDGKARWQGEAQPLSADLCDGIRRVLVGADPAGVTLTARATKLLGELRSDFDWVRPHATTLVEGPSVRRWFTFAGLRANQTIAAQLGALLGSGRVDNFSIPIDGTRSDLAARLPLLFGTYRPPTDGSTIKFGEGLPEALLASMISARSSDSAGVKRVQSEALNGRTP